MHQLLIVDAEEDLLWALSKNLFKDRNDIKIRTASAGEDALEQIRAQRIDLLITDTRVAGDIDGFNLILRTKELVPKARLIVMTAFSTGDGSGFEPSMGVAHFINKPFDTKELRDLVTTVLEEGEGFRGLMSDLSLADILALLCLCERTVLLHLNHRGRRGRIEVVGGQMQHAEFEDKRGAEAVWLMLGLKTGDIFMQSDFAQTSPSIEMSWQELLRDARAWLDEHGPPEELAAAEVDIPVEGWDDDELDPYDDDDMPRRDTRDRTASTDADDEAFGGPMGENPLGFSDEDLAEIEQAELPHFDPQRAPVNSLSRPRTEDTLPRAPMLRPTSKVMAPPAALSETPGADHVGLAAVSLDEIIATLRDEIPEFIACDIVHIEDGESIAGATGEGTNGEFDRLAAAAFYGEVMRTGLRAASALGEAELDALQIATTEHYVLGRLVPGRPYAQVVTMARAGNLGIAQVVMRRLDGLLTRAVPN